MEVNDSMRNPLPHVDWALKTDEHPRSKGRLYAWWLLGQQGYKAKVVFGFSFLTCTIEQVTSYAINQHL